MRPHHHQNPNYIHHQSTTIGSTIREVVFGLEDGMVSTFGSITGIAAATQDPFTILLAGSVIIGVESISMAVGSYVSSKSAQSIDARMLAEEREEIHNHPEEEERELVGMYVKDGWSESLAVKMAAEASQDKELILKEMAYRELGVIPGKAENPIRNGFLMGIAYIVGGAIPLMPYIIFSTISTAIWTSVVVSLVGLFLLGAGVTKYTKRSALRAGLEMLILAGLAGTVGYIVGQLMSGWMG
ncbi:MAG: hypothetical protein HOE53_04085 [Candidatus Magasanikbacteria bacterium]|jgi:vacuolar iron transporter family protein|nr:hypothetical protein [Candidatus Magasanikbacteria bacterium]